MFTLGKAVVSFVQDIKTYQFTHLSAVIAAHRHVEHRGVACFDPWLVVIE